MREQILKTPVTLSMSVDGRILDDRDHVEIETLLRTDALEELRVMLVPIIIGGEKARSLSGLPGDFLPEDRLFKLKEMNEVDGVLQLRYLRDRSKKD